MKNLQSAKDVFIALKKGYSLDTLTQELGISSENLKSKIFSLFSDPRKAEDVIRELGKNAKKHNNTKNTKFSENTQKEEEKTMVVTFPKQQIIGEQLEIAVQPKTVEDILKKLDTSFEVSNAEFSTIQAEAIKLEEQHESLEKKRYALRCKLVESDKRLEELSKEIEAIQSQLSLNMAEYEKLDAEMKALNEPIATKKQRLEVLREQLANFSMEVYAYENGEICIGSYPVVEIPGDVQHLFNELISSRIAEDLAVREVRQLARLILVAKAIEATGKHMDIVCDNQKLEEVFKKLSEKSEAS